jgi:hypothetical protein
MSLENQFTISDVSLCKMAAVSDISGEYFQNKKQGWPDCPFRIDDSRHVKVPLFGDFGRSLKSRQNDDFFGKLFRENRSTMLVKAWFRNKALILAWGRSL